MLRRFNFTDRIRINRKDVRISIRKENEKLFLDADLSAIADYDLPPESFVFVEAYRQANWMRFAFGRVGALGPESRCELSQFDSPEGLLFRVKVTPDSDRHTLLAEADKIPLMQPKADEGNRAPLLPVKPQKLGDEIYRLDFLGDYPLLLINSDAGSFVDIGKSPAFVSLVYPAVFREILIRIMLVDKHDDIDDQEEWRSRWLKFATLYPGLGEIPSCDDIDGRSDWINKVVAVFSENNQLRLKFEEFWKEAS